MARPRKVSDDAIHAMARRVFVEGGPGVSVGVVASRLGVTQAALFQRMGSKRALMRGALAPDPAALGALLDAFAAPPPAEGPSDRAAEILVTASRFLATVIPNLVVLRAAGVAMEAREVARDRTPPTIRLRVAFGGWLERAAAAGSIQPLDAEVVAEALLGAIEARCFNAYLGGRSFAPGDDEAFVRRLVTALVPSRGAAA